jgi:hypothetical protein
MKNRPRIRRGLLLAICLAPLAGCGGSTVPSVPSGASAAASAKDDPDVYRPPEKPKPAAAPAPAPSTGNSPSQAVSSDPDVYVPERAVVRPAPVAKKAPGNGASAKAPPAGSGENSPGFDPDSFNPENDRLSLAFGNSAVAKQDGRYSPALSLEDRLKLYQNDRTPIAVQAALEKQFAAESREAILAIVFDSPSAEHPPNSEGIAGVGSRLWSDPFIRLLDLNHQALATLGQRPAAIALAALTPNAEMRADLRRTLSRHWPEGPKSIRGPAASEGLLAEPGFLAVLKPLIRENRSRATAKSHTSKKVRIDAPAAFDDEARKPTSDSDWNSFLEELVRDFCRRSHAASLARSAAVYRSGGDSPADNHLPTPSFPLLPGCETAAAHHFEWRGKENSPLPRGTDHFLSVDYRRFEKRAKAGTVAAFYRRQIDACVEHSLADGIWLDGFSERKDSDRARSIDVLITWPKSGGVAKAAAEERELTVEVFCVETKKTND